MCVCVCVCVCVCSDMVSRLGMFCAITTTTERCKTEGVVDVFQVVKALRVHKPGAIHNVVSVLIDGPLAVILLLSSQFQWQYEAVFDAIVVFLDSFDTYANFNQ